MTKMLQLKMLRSKTTVVSIRLIFALSFFIMQPTLTGCQNVVITPSGNQMTTTGSDVTMACSLLDYRPPAHKRSNLRITWYGPDSEEITRTGERNILFRPNANSLRLTVTKIEESDGGKYRCQATDTSSGLQLSNETKIVVHEEISFDETSISERHLLGSTALLRCKARGLPKPEISWYFNGRIISSDGSKYVFYQEGLSIEKLDLRDGGMYECRATVAINRISKSRYISLDILYPPVIMRSPVADDVIRGQNVTLHCRADGNPPVRYEWLRDQKVTYLLSSKVILHEKGETYTIHRLSEDDEGRYYCRVSNEHGSKELSVDIKMLIPPSIRPLPYRASVQEGQTISLSCEAAGVPTPMIAWTPTDHESLPRDKQAMIRSGKWVESLQPGLNTLTIRNVNRSLTGSLDCFARNLAGSDTKTIPLVVEYRPSASVAQSDVVAWAGERRSLRCVADGVPSPTVTWQRNQQPIQNNYMYQIANSQTGGDVSSLLTIRPPSTVDHTGPTPYGTYQCVAKNGHGVDSAYGRLIEAVTPDVVRNVSVVEETPTTVKLRATPPANSANLMMPILSWMVKYEMAENGAEQHSHVFNFSSDDSLVVSGLNPGTTYTFYLSVSNAVGYSNPLKFRVTTPRRLNLNQQSDVPSKSDDDGRYKIAETKTEESNVKHGESKIDIFSDQSLMSNRDMVVILIATAVGFSVVIISIITAVVCVSLRKKKLIQRRHSCSDPPLSHSVSGSRRASSEPRDNRIVLHPMWNPADPTADLPDILRNDSVLPLAGPSSTPRERLKRPPPHQIRSQPSTPRQPMCRSGSMICASLSTVGTAPAPRKSYGSRTLQHQQRSFDDTSFTKRCAHDEPFDLPPPPAFLLYPDGGEGDGMGGQRMRARGFSHGQLLDGYCSGDNVDDAIDHVDYTIRMPSVHSQMFAYS